jgi:predicted O-linked N-acetylglucosamine transferase (SPINDLY family)
MDPRLQEGMRLHQAGDIAAATLAYQDVLDRNPRDVNALCSLAYCRFQTGEFEEAQRLFGVALGIQPGDLNALCIRGVALAQLSRHDEGLACFDAALALQPSLVAALSNRAATLLELSRPEEALRDLERALAANPRDINVLNNRGNALLQLGRASEALASYQRALAINPSHAESWFNRGNALSDMTRFQDAVASYDRALALKSSFAEAWFRRGMVLLWMKQQEEAVASLSRALNLAPKLAPMVLRARSQAFLQLARYPEAIADAEAAVAADPDAPYVRGDASFCRRSSCDWSRYDEDERERRDGVANGQRIANPWVALLSSESPAEQQHWSRLWAADLPIAPAFAPAAQLSHQKLRIAYLSADFTGHAASEIMIGIFEQHDRSRFETYAVTLENLEQDAFGRRLRGAFDHTIDATTSRDEEVAGLIRSHEIDIAVDMMGFTSDSRPGILARRPAPVQASYLGFAGTMGAPWIDYLLADDIVVPQAERIYYDESIVALPGCYHPYDGGALPLPLPTRAEAGLPETGFVFCCFNNSCKITPDLFAVWMRLLAAVPESVLWLRERSPFVAPNLRREAEQRGISPERLIFAPVWPTRDDYRAHLTLADLFLDTLPYNAHTTAADALWAGVPVVTCTGATFAGRVATSMLTACGLRETITPSLEDYEALTLRLARDPAELAQLRQKVAAARTPAGLIVPQSRSGLHGDVGAA